MLFLGIPAGTHVLAVAVASWFATASFRASILAAFVPLFLGWVIYLFAPDRGESTRAARLVRERG